MGVFFDLADQFGNGVAQGDPVGVRINLGELAGIVCDVDIGSHISSMRRFCRTCKIAICVPGEIFCMLDYQSAAGRGGGRYIDFIAGNRLVFPEGRSCMGNANRLVGYLASVVSASLFYLVWTVISIELMYKASDGHIDIQFDIGLAIIFMLLSVGPAFVLMAFPWYLSVRWYDRLRRYGLTYFSLIGAATILVIGSMISSLSPKPLFIEDQTFLEGFMIAIERQGICLLLTGFVFGLTFWLVSERLRYSHSIEAS